MIVQVTSAAAAAAYMAANEDIIYCWYLKPLTGKNGKPNNFENSGSMPEKVIVPRAA
jgi:hypothetical protein